MNECIGLTTGQKDDNVYLLNEMCSETFILSDLPLSPHLVREGRPCGLLPSVSVVGSQLSFLVPYILR